MRICAFVICLALTSYADAVESPSEGPPQCRLLFSTVPFTEYVAVTRKYELNRETLRAAEKQMISYLGVLVAQSPDRANPELNVQRIIRNFSGAFSTRVRGLSHVAFEFEHLLAQELKLPLAVVQNSTRSAADDPQAYRSSSMAEFIMRGAPSIEAYLFDLLRTPKIADLKSVTLETEGTQISAPFVAGPRQFEMVRTVLQYTLTEPGDHLLEIGYGTTAVSLAVASFTKTKVLALDPLMATKDANEVFASYGVELVSEAFPTASAKVRERAPFKVIFALDVLRRHGKILKTDKSPRDFVQALHDLLADGGTVVIVNDYMDLPNFTREEAVQAGFEVVRWGFRQSLPEELMKYTPYISTVDAGQLAVYVLRKGIPKVGKDGRFIQKKTDFQ